MTQAPVPPGPPALPGMPVPGSLPVRLYRHGLTVYVSLTCLVGALVFLAMAVATGGHVVEPWRLLVVLALCVFADLPLLETRIGHNLESFTFGELCVVLAIALVPTPYAVVIAASCVLAFHLIRRIALFKAGFNAANFAVAMTLAAGSAHAVSQDDLAGVSPLNVLALLLGTLVFFTVNSGGVALAVSLSQGTPFLAVYRDRFGLRLTVAGGNAGIGVAVLAMADWSSQTVLVLPPVLATMYASYRGYLRASHERDAWQQLEAATRELNQLDEEAVVQAALARAAQMFSADVVAVVVLDDSPGGCTVYTGDASGLVSAARGDAGGFGAGDGETPADAGSLMVYSSPLDGPRGRIGLLRLGFRGPVQLNQRERRVLQTFAHSVSTTLQNARLYSEMRSHAEAKAREAAHDALTGLGNRSLLHDVAQGAMADASQEAPCGLFIIDLDHFKDINDTLGHAAGDLLLRQVADRLLASVPGALAVCRLGGDEFAVLHGDLGSGHAVDDLARHLLGVMAEPVVFDGLRLSVEGSVGVACYPQDAGSFDELLKRADVALYQAKASRGSFARYRSERDDSSLHRMALAAELRTALDDDQLVVHFQPQYDVALGVLVGAEALVRWQHPQRGLLFPDEFISAVEHSGLIRAFTLAVLDKAVAQCASWTGVGRTLSVAVNLSARNLLDSELPADVAQVLVRHGLDPARLVLEITETTMMSELEVVETVLADLRSSGVQLSVDDFGTGYSSLSFLQRVQVNEIKIDRTFVAGLVTSDNDRALVAATVQLAHSLGARTVGEGVEDAALLAVLQELGCDLAQGYHLGRPLPAEAMRALVAGQDRRAAGEAVVVCQPRPALAASRHLRAVVGGS